MAQSIPVHTHDGNGRPLKDSTAPELAKLAKALVKEPHDLLRSAVEVLTPATMPVPGSTAPAGHDTSAGLAAVGTDMSQQAIAELAAEVRLAQGGNASAMAALIENNRAWVRGIAYTVLGDAHLAEDAAQEVCVRVVKHLKGLDTPEAFRPWVYRMTRNVALSMAQRRERTPQPLSLEAEQLQEGQRVCRSAPPGAALEEDERVNSILQTINRLPDIYREVLVLKHVQDMSYSEMSSILGVSVKSLEVRLVRARKLLQERLGRRFDRGRKRDPREEKH
ncbi:MAG TPA: RNA polymerase sigma factor [Planctomycetota bacterium]|nr:RNA polymerase sigma factor [Planctomycetota bacterium]